jgi:hypothetical protein
MKTLVLLCVLTLTACRSETTWGTDQEFCDYYRSCDLHCMFHVCSD